MIRGCLTVRSGLGSLYRRCAGMRFSRLIAGCDATVCLGRRGVLAHD